MDASCILPPLCGRACFTVKIRPVRDLRSTLHNRRFCKLQSRDTKLAYENGRISNFEGHVTLTLTFDRVTLHTVVHYSQRRPQRGGGKGPGPHKKIAPWAMGRIVARVLPNVSLAMWPSKTLFGPHLIDSGAGTDHSSTSTYTPNFTEIEETFVDVRRLHGRAFETGFTRSTLSKSRPTLLPFPTHLFLYPSLLPLLIHHSAHLLLPLSFTPGSKPTSFTNPRPRRPIYSFTSSSRTASKDYCLDRFF